MKHELWMDEEGLGTFCLAGERGDDARALLEPGSKLVWSCDAKDFGIIQPLLKGNRVFVHIKALQNRSH
ncbi:hypothetical protein MN202_15120 [Rheinheimera muenzenbergensis]|uniref:Cold shock protein, CspA family n=1 Tax=Rheinheimera muenzenbergensis TaxID=1193628 RepID=A0ABU8C9I0_9GAMM